MHTCVEELHELEKKFITHVFVNIISTNHIKRMSSLIPCLHNLFCIFIQERRDLCVGFRLACLPSFNIMIFFLIM